VTDLAVRPVPLQATRALRRDVLRPTHTLEQVASREPAEAYAVGAYDGEELVAVGFVLREGEPGAWRIRGMATAPHARSRGAGSAVLGALIEHATAHGARRIWCNARTRALPFYARAGMRPASEEYDVPESGPHYLLVLRPQ
jgi:GNAT superfamily N-acetyltransferase